MKALVLEKAMEIVHREVPDPVLDDDRSVLVRVKAVSICGSDVHGMDGSTGRRIPPIIMGHEAAGVIEKVGKSVRDYKIGDRVTFDSTIYCGECHFCRKGTPNLCDNRRVLGVSCDEYRRDGAFAEYVVVPERILYPIPAKLDFVSAAMTEPLAVGCHAARLGKPDLGESIAVIGAGLIGLLLIQALRANCSGTIVAVDMDEGRLAAAKKYGADVVVKAGPDAAEKVRAVTGRGVDLAFEAVGASAPIATAIDSLRKGGRLVLIGNVSAKVEMPLQKIIARQIQITGSNAIESEYPLALALMESGKVDVKSLVSAVVPLAEGPSWMKRLYDREPGLLKVVLEP